MAHANPEFALGLMRPDRSPVRHQLPGPASLGALRARMVEIGECIRYDIPHSAAEAEAYRLWSATVRQQRATVARSRQLEAAVAAPVGGMHGGDARGERFIPPVRRGEGRTKRWQQS